MPDTLRGGIAINEILAWPDAEPVGFDTDGSGHTAAGDAFIELINMSSEAIDISGIELWDPGYGLWFTFPDGTVLQPGATAVVLQNAVRNFLPDVTGNNLAFDGNSSAPIFSQ